MSKLQMVRDSLDNAKAAIEKALADGHAPEGDLRGVTVAFHFVGEDGGCLPIIITYSKSELEPFLNSALSFALKIRNDPNYFNVGIDKDAIHDEDKPQ